MMSASTGADQWRISPGTTVTCRAHSGSLRQRFCSVTTALAFLSSAYTLIGRWAAAAAASEAATRGPRPAPRTMTIAGGPSALCRSMSARRTAS
jgi:hypothetical protein